MSAPVLVAGTCRSGSTTSSLTNGKAGGSRHTQCAPELADRLRTFAEPARGSRLPSNDLVHHDFNLSNVLVDGSNVQGVVDWDDAGRGCRAQDLATQSRYWP